MTPNLSGLGLKLLGKIHYNLSSPALYEHAVRNEEGKVAAHGPIVTTTGQYTGRSPNDKFTVMDPSSADKVWWGKHNKPFEPAKFDALQARVIEYLDGKPLYVQDLYAGADPEYRMPIRVVSEYAWHNLFARNMFVRPGAGDSLPHAEPGFTVVNAPRFLGVPARDGTNSEAFIIVNFTKRLVLIGGTSYAGETKKSIFGVLNFILPQQGVLGMHCSANVGPAGDTALFFGLSGTGKTTLSADPERRLIGDDEHGWSDQRVFNFEGGCYAKVINLSAEQEPEIYATTRRFGTILENVVMHPDTRELDLADASLAENTRASYPIDYIPNIMPEGLGPHPKNIVMLTCDAFGVLPPISRLTPEQAMYHFISGYTAKIAGTERGIKEPKETFSTCFGAPFMTLHPAVYAKLLGEKIAKHGVRCWLVNTGWTGGPYGVGHRMKISHTRAMLHAALGGALNDAPTQVDPIFGLHVPKAVPNVPSEVLWPSNTWADKRAYEEKARYLAQLFVKNFEEYAGAVPESTRAAGPKP